MVIEKMLAMGDLMRACFIYKRYMDSVVASAQKCHDLTISPRRAQELKDAAEMMRRALAALEPDA